MLNIYRSRESIDKESIIYGEAKAGGKTLVIVPDQYTLAAEKQAMDRMNSRVLLNVEITGISHLGYRLLQETGDRRKNVIDRYGRHMLVSRILRSLDEELLAFKGFYSKESFVEAINDFISLAKQHEITDHQMAKMANEIEGNVNLGAFSRKLHDLALIYQAYQRALEGEYTDNEDLLDLYIQAISNSKLIANRQVWIYGFDSFTPKNVSFILALAKRARETNVYITYDSQCRDEDLFVLSERTSANFQRRAEEGGIPCKLIDIKEENVSKLFPNYNPALQQQKASAIKALEKELFAVGKQTYEEVGKGADAHEIQITECLSMNGEAEAAAAYVLKLLCEENYRLSDIVLICNDQEVRGPMIERVFVEYGMDVFGDRKRQVIDSPIAIYVMALLEGKARGYRTSDVMMLLKTGLTDIGERDMEELENYVFKYGIRGHMWEKPFTRGAHESKYDNGGLEKIEDTRRAVMTLFEDFGALYDESETYGQFAQGYLAFLEAEKGLLEKIQGLADRQREGGMGDLAEETLQIWDVISHLLDQIKEIMKDEPFDGKEFSQLLRSGLSQIQVGVLPPSVDDILLGTMQRTRSGDVKAMLVIGANDDVIPKLGKEDILFSREELNILTEGGRDLGLAKELRLMEEDLAIYRNLAKPSRHLWLSYSSLNQDNKEIRPAEIITSIKKIFPNVQVHRDPALSTGVSDTLGGKVNSLRRYTEAMRKKSKNPAWNLVEDWLGETQGEILAKVREALEKKREEPPLPPELAAKLFARYKDKQGDTVYVFSPTGLERYRMCPFDFFVDYGLGAEELREDRVGGREIGELYHHTLQVFTEKVAGGNLWNGISREEADKLVEEITEEWRATYRSRLFDKSRNEEYMLKRAIMNCKYIAWSLVEQARAGKIRESFFEARFALGPGKKESTNAKEEPAPEIKVFPPIVREFPGGKAYIQGKIDRVDILENGRVKIIDYKTGKEGFDKRDVEAGYRLQLMLYLEAALEKKRLPAGVFYFLIKEPDLELSMKAAGSPDITQEDLEKAIKKEYRMDGVMVDREDVLYEIAGDFESESEVVPLSRNKDGSLSKNSMKYLVAEDEFEGLQRAVDQAVTEICQGIAEGRIDVAPAAAGSKDPCQYCGNKNICRYGI